MLADVLGQNLPKWNPIALIVDDADVEIDAIK
jgi:hypothetical protein